MIKCTAFNSKASRYTDEDEHEKNTQRKVFCKYERILSERIFLLSPSSFSKLHFQRLKNDEKKFFDELNISSLDIF